jgi:hypothetical protein
MKLKIFLTTAVALLVLTGVAAAHHGSAIFDATREVTLTGRVAEFRFVNPHVIVFINVSDSATGKTEKWLGETFSAARLIEFGWNKNTLKPGQRIALTGYPAKAGMHWMAIHKIVQDGHELPLR